MRSISLRPRRFDELGLRRALSDRLLPFLVAAMALLAALALAGWVGAASLASSWQNGSQSTLTVQVPDPDEPSRTSPDDRADRVLTLLSGTPGVLSARKLSDQELSSLLRPWLGGEGAQLGLRLPAIIGVHLADRETDLSALGRRLREEAPGVLIEEHANWIRRLTILARSLQACAALALLLVISVFAAVVTVATRSGLSVRRDAIEIVHGLGASDGYIAARFARRAMALATIGGITGAVLALPVLLVLVHLIAPFSSSATELAGSANLLAAFPSQLWLGLITLPAGAAVLGFLTAQATVRRWLRRFP
jgi:cell division transport system permease protein